MDFVIKAYFLLSLNWVEHVCNVTFLLFIGKNQKTIKENLERIMEPKPNYLELFSGLMNMEFESEALLFLNSISSKWNYLSYSKTEKHCDQIVTHFKTFI